MTFSPSPFRTALWALAGLSALFALVLIIVTLALPNWLTGRGAALATDALGRVVRIERAQFQPWRLAVVAEGISIAGAKPGLPPLLTLDRMDAALSLRSLVRGHVVIESLSLERPDLRLARVAEGLYDIDDLIRRFADRRGATPPVESDEPEFAVYNIELTEGRVRLDDRPVERQHELAGLQLALPYLSTLESDVAVKVQPHLSGRLDGVAFDSRAEALPFADQASGRLSLKLAGLDLAPLAPYVPASLPARLQSGKLDMDLALDFTEQPRQAPGVKLSGRVDLHDLALTRPDGKPLLSWKRLQLPLADLQPLRRQLGFGNILLESPQAWLWPQRPSRAPAPAASAAAPWQVSVAGVQIREGRLLAQDLPLQDIALRVGAAAWPLKQPVELEASLSLEQGRADLKARLSPEQLAADLQLQDFALERLARWLPLPGKAGLAGALSGQAQLAVTQPLAEGAAERALLSLKNLRLADARLGLPGAPRAVTLGLALLDQADVDPAKRTLRLGRLQLEAPRTQVHRDATGRLDLAALKPADSAQRSDARPSDAQPWSVQLGELAVEQGSLRWHDAAVPAGVAPVALALDTLRLQASALRWPALAPVAVRISARIAPLGDGGQPVAASAGQLQWNGSVGLAPLSAQGVLETRGLPLQLLDGYLDPALGLHLARAELGMKGDVAASQRPDGWQLSIGGDVRVGALALMQTRDVEGRRTVGEDLLSWQLMQLDGVRLAMAPGAPPRLAVREALLEDAYARLIVNEQGRFNLREVGQAEAAAAAASSVAAAASAPASAAPVAAVAPAEFAVERIRINRGLVDFNDRFVKPNYSARLSELHGSLGAFSSTGTAMAPVTLRGKVAGTGLLEVDGQLKPGGALAMDVQANATDVELTPLSAYAAKYLGYAIERGKLSARMRYQVEPGGRLVANNQIILSQLTLGERVDSPLATALPVRLALGLLKDKHGVIDIDLPVSGSLSDPEFSVGGVAWKLFLKLIGKALTSPFSLFTGNDSPEAGQLPFKPGTAELVASDRLDRIARQLADKAGIQLTLTGWADPLGEGMALREQRLAQALAAEQARVPGTPADMALSRVYGASGMPNKPRNVLGLPKDLPPEQMRNLLLASYTVDPEELRQLAVARAVAVRDALLARGAPNARVFLAAPKLCDSSCAQDWRPHVEMSLAAN
ncbi:DUF748 domain-containing protein [Roseateles sp. DC23W]|uniref:DUF748 domain-containing protein n=1 Tax=Pelomonas dachongensis TaxID=3299029 RepID=A0ABW7EM40_9BURK